MRITNLRPMIGRNDFYLVDQKSFFGKIKTVIVFYTQRTGFIYKDTGCPVRGKDEDVMSEMILKHEVEKRFSISCDSFDDKAKGEE